MSKTEKQTPRASIEIIRQHDILDEILNNEEVTKLFNWEDDNGAKRDLLVIKRTLCWVLQHDEGRWLSENMQRLEKALADFGFILRQVQ